MKFSKSLSLFILFIFSAVTSYAQISKSVTVIKPGTLGTLITWEEKYTLKNLTISGKIDARDIRFINGDIPNIETVDLGGATILPYYGNEGTVFSKTIYYPENEMPPTSFSYSWELYVNGNKKLKSIILPATLTSIGTNAFNDCANLTYVKFPANLDSIKTAAFKNCTSLQTIECLSTEPPICSNEVFMGVNKNTCMLKVSNNAASKYTTQTSWQSFNIKSSGYVVSATYNNEQAGSVIGLNYRFYNYNEKVKLTARRKNSNSTLSWLENKAIISTDSIYEFFVTADRKLEAKFARNENLHVTAKGSLSKLIGKPSSITHLTLTGNIDAIDIRFIRDSLRALEVMDIRKSNIQAYTGANGPCYYVSAYNENELPAMAFFTYEAYLGNMYLKTVKLPDNLTGIGEYAFRNCTKIDSLVLPIHLNTMANSVFTNCYSLKTLSVLSPKPIVSDQTTFYSFTPANCTLVVPLNTVQKYDSVKYWTNFNITSGGYSVSIKSSNVQNGTVSGVESRFYNLNENVTLKAKAINGTRLKGWYENGKQIQTDSILEIGVTDNREFIAIFELPATVQQSEAGTLKNRIANYKNITHLTLSGKIDARDFQFLRDSMPALEYLDISNTTIMAYSGDVGTSYTSNYAEHQLPASAFSVASYPSAGKTFLRNIVLPMGLRSIGERAFYNCTALETIYLPETVIGICTNSFVNCTSLKSISFPSGLNAIDYTAFENCSNLETIYNFNTMPLSVNPYVFTGVNIGNCKLVVPTNSLAAYSTAEVWKNFKVNEGGYVVTAASSQLTTGKVTGIENRFYTLNEQVTLQAEALNGTFFNNWTDNGEIVSTNLTYTFTVSRNHKLTANFFKEQNITVETAGTMKDKVTDLNTTKLTVSGNIDARDFKFMRDQMLALEELDISSCKIVGYSGLGGTGWGSMYYAPNLLPEYAFCNKDTRVGKQSLKSVVLPDSLTVIGSNAFYGCSNLKSISLPKGLMYMYYEAFRDCYSLEAITLPASLSLFQGAFYNCKKLSSVTLSEGIKAIDTHSFHGCTSLESIKLPESLTTIRQNAFENCISLKKIILPPSITSIENSAFKNCVGIDTLVLPTNITTISSYTFEGCSGMTSIIFPSQLDKIEYSAFLNCKGLITLSFPEKLKSIGDNAFQSCSGLKTVDFPESISTLGYKSFTNCTGLIALKIPGKIATMGSAFSNCTALKTVQLSTGLKTISGDTFSGCSSLTSITIPSGVTYLGSGAFRNCTALTEVNLPAGLTNIDSYVFSGCSNLKTIEIPAGTTSVGGFAFEDCTSLSSVTLPKELSSIGTAIFENCTQLTEIINLNPVPLPNNSMTYGFSYMDQSKCTLIVHSSSVDAFKAAPEWKKFNVQGGGYSVIASANNIMIGTVKRANKFYLLTESATLEAICKLGSTFVNWTENGAIVSTLPTFTFQITTNRNLVANFVRNITVHVPVAGALNDSIIDANSVTALTVIGTIDARDVKFMRDNMLLLDAIDLSKSQIAAYSGTDGTVDYSYIYAEDALPIRSFEYKNTLKSIALPTGATAIESNAFGNCTKLSSIIWPTSLRSIGSAAFADCKVLNINSLPGSLTTISHSAFSGCSAISSMELPSGLTSMEQSAFSLCVGLTHIKIPGSISVIKDFSFSNCSNLETVEFSEGLTRISYTAFASCSKLKTLNFPASLTFIGTATFMGCTSLTEISLPANVSVIASNAFAGCTKLVKITNANSTPIKIDADVFASVIQSDCSLIVPNGAEAEYKSAAVWRRFKISGSGYSISALSNNFSIGQVDGVENRFYSLNENVTITATPKEEATFINWTENGKEVSTDLTYSFIVTTHRKLVANFKKETIVNQTVAGTLANNIPNPSTVTTLQLSGNIDARDIKYLRDNFLSLTELDLKNAHIQAYTGNYGTYDFATYYPENEMPCYSFYNYQVTKNSLISVVLPTNLDSIGENAFMECQSLKSIILPESLKSIKYGAFYNCSALDTITLPTNLSEIQPRSFSKCTSLMRITNMNPTPVIITSDVFSSSIYNSCRLVIPNNSVPLYKVAEGWKHFYMHIGLSLESKVLPVEIKVLLYPTITSNFIYLKTNEDVTVNMVEVCNFSGKLYLVSTDSSSRIDVSNLPIGIYYVKVGTSKGVSTQKIIKK